MKQDQRDRSSKSRLMALKDSRFMVLGNGSVLVQS